MADGFPTTIDGTQLKHRLLELARRYLAVTTSDEAERSERGCRLEALLGALTTSVFRLVVMGEIKKGKSSFINALLARANLLPVDTDVATSTVYKIVYGTVEKYTVFFHNTGDNAGSARAPLEINHRDLPKYGTEQGNPGNQLAVEFIAAELPHPLLDQGVAIIDTPGGGGLFRKHRDITFAYAPNADVVFFVLDSVETVISQDEIRFLKELQKNTRQIVFLQTKVDIAGEEQVQAWRTRNLIELEKALGVESSRLPYFLVSAKLKQSADATRSVHDLEDSGYLAILHFLQRTLIPRRDAIIAERWTKSLAAEVAAAGQLAVDRRAIANETNEPKLAEYGALLRTAEQEFEAWQNEKWPRTTRRFQDESGRLKRETRNLLQDTLSPESVGFRAVLDYTRTNCSTAEQVSEAMQDIVSTHAAQCNQDANAILSDFRNAYSSVYQEAIGAALDDLRLITLPTLDTDSSDSRRETGSVIPAWREALMNANVFGGFARAATGKIGLATGAATMLGLISAPIGVAVVITAAVASVAISIWTGVRGYKLARERQMAATLSNLERAMTRTAQTAIKSAQRALEEISAELDSKARDGFDAFRADFKNDFGKRQRALVASKTRTEVETRQLLAALSTEIQAYADILKGVQEVAAQLKGT